jgi:glycosyltransferase involved in cell wall biosynthesis
MKKVLIFSIAYIPFVGGAELAVKEITDRLGNEDFSARGGPASGWHFDLITLRFKKEWPVFERMENVNVYRVSGPKLFFPFIAFGKALSLHRQKRYNIAWSIMANRAGFAALFFKFLNPKVKFLLTLQEGDSLDYPKKRMAGLYFFLKPFFKAIFTKADYIQAISNYLAEWAKNMEARCPIEVVPNGADINKFKSQISNLKSNGLKQELKIKEGEKILITTSRLVEKNAVGDIVEAMKYLPDSVKLLILGSGPLEKNLKSQISNLKIEDRVKMAGEISRGELPKYLAISDIFVRPSLSEGLGSSFLEAMIAGVPVIGTAVGGIPDFLEEGETGLFCEANNPKSIAEKAMEYINNPERAEKIAENAQKLVREKYDLDLIAQKMEDIFNKLT